MLCIMKCTVKNGERIHWRGDKSGEYKAKDGHTKNSFTIHTWMDTTCTFGALFQTFHCMHTWFDAILLRTVLLCLGFCLPFLLHLLASSTESATAPFRWTITCSSRRFIFLWSIVTIERLPPKNTSSPNINWSLNAIQTFHVNLMRRKGLYVDQIHQCTVNNQIKF